MSKSSRLLHFRITEVPSPWPSHSLLPENLMTATLSPPILRARLDLRPALPGLALAMITLLFAFGLGIVFGLNEDLIKSRLSASAAAVETTVYHGDAAAAKPVLEKSWAY